MSAIDKNLTKTQEKEVILMAEKAVSDMKKVVKWYNYLKERDMMVGGDEEE